ncbi:MULTISPECIES: DUF2239 family protein [Rhodomicrobium]|uniref:DUF2239 family protein n=1 Tax=Rhodomicrobium TaxID=1068 RepID=UPI000B4C02F7|nr:MULTISPECIES: DUF2239 family protein [Rhodomicrobium]
MTTQRNYTAFDGTRCIASGGLEEVAASAKAALDADQMAQILIFDDRSAGIVELDFRGSVAAVVARAGQILSADGPDGGAAETEPGAKRPGRPKLGVTGREVTLLPRHWDWLNAQPGGASVALRKLVDEARRAHEGRDRIRAAQTAAYRFMTAMAGNQPGMEEATRALFAADAGRFAAQIANWPRDLRDYAQRLAAPAFQSGIA